MPPRLILKFLGLPQVLLDGKPVATDRRKAIALLAYLAVNDAAAASQDYRRESLTTLLWPDYEQARAFSNLRRVIWEVHQAVGIDWLIADRETVKLGNTAEIELDVGQFRDLLARGRQQSDPALRLPLLSDSVKLYRDHFLTGFNLKDAPNFNEWAFAESEELRRQFAEALTLLTEDLCALGQAEQAIPYGRRLVALDPLNESAHRRLMEVYLQAGQQSAALKQYQTLEQTLRQEMNLDPQPETLALYKKLRRGEMRPAAVAKPSPQVSPRHNLPLQLSSFIGRAQEQAEISSLIAGNRLVTLTGAGGIGKTRLSVQIASALLKDFPAGAWLVELAPLADPVHVPQAVVNALGLIEQAGRSPLTILTDFLLDKPALLVLDNCEHLVQACAGLAESLLQACPDLHILATSREALGVPGEMAYLVPPLGLPGSGEATGEAQAHYEAVQLFLERARAASPGFTMTPDTVPVIVKICQRLDGIPLALELAAARVKLLRVEEIATRLEDSFRLLTGGARTALPRHQTLQALIDWSHDLLTEPEQALFRRLSVFADGWTLEAAESVCADPGQDGILPHQILDRLSSLVNKSLILAERKEDQEARYHMLDTIRQYAHEKLWVAGEEEPLRQQHLAYFVALAERAEPNLRAFNMVSWLDRLEAEHDNIRSALEYAQESDNESQLRLASALLWFWHIRGHKNEGIEWVERALSIEALDRDGQPMTPGRAMLRGKALNASGSLMVMNNEIGRAPVRLNESLALFKELGPAGKQGLAYALLRLGSLQASYDQARNMLEQSLTWFREVGDKFGAAECLMQLSGIAQRGNQHERALRLAEEQLALSREIGDWDGIAVALTTLGDMVLSQDDHQKAIALYEEAISGFRAVMNTGAVSLSLTGFGDIYFWHGDYEQAAKIYEEALSLAHELGYKYIIAYNLFNLGAVAWFRGEYVRAAQLIAESRPMLRSIGHHWLTASSLHALGDIALAEGDDTEAAPWYEAELAFSQETHLEVGHVFALVGLGKVAWEQGDFAQATKHFEQGLRMSREADVKPAIFQLLYRLGRTAQAQGDAGAARGYYVEALKTQRQRVATLFNWAWVKTYRSSVAYPLAAFAVLDTAQGQMSRAARLFAAAETLYPPLRFEASAKERTEHDQAITAARAALGEEAFAAAWEEGKKLTLEEAVAYALAAAPKQT